MRNPLIITFENRRPVYNLEVVVLAPVGPKIGKHIINSCRRLVQRTARSFRVCRLVFDPGGAAPQWGTPHPHRQEALAKIRQDMVDKYLGTADWVAWIDADIVDYPANLLPELISRANGGIAAPIVLMDGKPGSSGLTGDGFGPGRFFDVAGYVEGLRWARFEEPWFDQPGPEYSLDSVGSCYVVNAEIYRKGARHTADPYSLDFVRRGLVWGPDTVKMNQQGPANCFTEHFSVCQWAKQHGFPVHAYRDIVVRHANVCAPDSSADSNRFGGGKTLSLWPRDLLRRAIARARRMAERSRVPHVAGFCPICEIDTVFLQTGPWLRDQLLCECCRSIPRWRALIHVLQTRFPNWRELRIHESSPSGPPSAKLQRQCRFYTPSHFFPDVPPGGVKNGIRCENLERQTFADESFDLVVTSDVFEHVLDPARGFSEIARTLRPGGAHVFTVPWYWWKKTLVRAVRGEDGAVINLEPPDYHGNPISDKGSLVVTEWGPDLCDFIYRASGLTTTAVLIRDMKMGIAGEFGEVFISTKSAASRDREAAPESAAGALRQ